MNLGITAAVFPLIFLGELPDKTMFASLVLATRGRPRSVWLGAAGAFTVHVIIAITIGLLIFRILPHRAVEAAVAVMFGAGAILAVRAGRGDEADNGGTLDAGGTGARGPAAAASRLRTAATAFVVVFLAEWGDLTQVLTANLAARYHTALPVGVGAVLALWTVAALAVTGGRSLQRFISVTAVRITTAVLLTALAGWTAWGALTGT